MERQKSRKPKFRIVHDLQKAATIINEPHEDFPLRVGITQVVLDSIRNICFDTHYVDEFLCKSIHGAIFGNEPHGGSYRDVEVSVGSHIPMSRILVPHAIKNLFPTDDLRTLTAEETYKKLIDRYMTFETIHPFQDGNGRVGGVIMAALSWAFTGEYLVDCTHNPIGSLIQY